MRLSILQRTSEISDTVSERLSRSSVKINFSKQFMYCYKAKQNKTLMTSQDIIGLVIKRYERATIAATGGHLLRSCVGHRRLFYKRISTVTVLSGSKWTRLTRCNRKRLQEEEAVQCATTSPENKLSIPHRTVRAARARNVLEAPSLHIPILAF